MLKWLRLLDELIAPKGVKCLCCVEWTHGELLCPDCKRSLEALMLPPEESVQGDVCSVCQYDGVAKQLVLLLKEDCCASAAEALAEIMVDGLERLQLPQNTVITWVTMPEVRRRSRGIDHGRELCEALSRRCGLPVRQLLTRTGRVHTQRGLSREKRLRNLNGTFLCSEKLDCPVLLVDDVFTTGATSSTCAEALLAAGAQRVYVLTAARARGPQKRFEFRKADLYGF